MSFEIIEVLGKQISTIISWKWRSHCYIRLYYHRMHMFLFDRMQPVLGSILYNGGKYRNNCFSLILKIEFNIIFPEPNFLFKNLFCILLQLISNQRMRNWVKDILIDWLINVQWAVFKIHSGRESYQYSILSTHKKWETGWVNRSATFDWHCKNMVNWAETKYLVFCNSYNAATLLFEIHAKMSLAYRERDTLRHVNLYGPRLGFSYL